MKAEKKIMLKKKSLRFLIALFRTFFLIGICFVILYPLFIKITSSFMVAEDVYDPMVRYIPKHFTLENYELTMELLHYWPSFVRSLLLVTVTSLITVMSVTVSAYGLARFKFKGRNLLFGLIVLSMVVPPDVLLLPYFLKFRYFDILGLIELCTGQPLNLSDNALSFFILGGVCMGLKNGLYIFLMRQYFRGMPRELEEAAYVDGSGLFRTLVTIMLPSAIPMMVTVFLFSVVFMWLDVIYTPVFMTNVELLPNQIGMLSHAGTGALVGVQTELEFSLLRNAGMVLLILPLIILYLVAQKSFVQSIGRSGITG